MVASQRPSGSQTNARAQTTLDFAVGISLFLLTLSFVFVFVPGMLDPFADTTQVETPAVNRVAEELTTRTLGDADEPYVLDKQCTIEFFTDTTADCNFNGKTTAERVGIVSWRPVNVTIRGNVSGDHESNILCWDEVGNQWLEYDNPDCDVVLTRGSNPAGSGGKTVSAHRVSLLDGNDVTVEVVMW